MPRQPDSAHGWDATGALRRVRRRIGAAHVLEGAAAGAAVGAVAAAVVRAAGWTAPTALGVAALGSGAGAVAWYATRRTARTASAAAVAVERARPDMLNVVFTAVELDSHADRAPAWIRARVLQDADRRLAGVAPGRVVPLGARAAACLAAAALAIAAALNVPGRAARVLVPGAGSRASGSDSSPPFSIVAILHPPGHTRLPVRTETDPDRLSAVEGTRVRLEIGGASGHVRFGAADLATRREGGATVVDMALRASGYLAIERGSAGGPRLIPVVVTPDRVPAIKVEKPARDLLVPTAAASIALEASATDDYGLERLLLRYTKVSGSGEQYEFEEGELPLDVDRRDARSWRARGELALSRLGLEPGDAIVYRLVARDGRPGDAGIASSDTFYVEVAGPGQVALEGFEMPPDRERHALSQQMIVLKIQRLRARERALAADALREQTGAIAAEQRAVRTNFVFLMGGHVEDEEVEAEQSHEIQEGRLENTSGREISSAIAHMSLAEQRLAAIDTAAALKQAILAVDALQRAFGRNRYILRTLPVRSRVDPSRRLTGALDGAAASTRTPPDLPRDPRAQSVRELLAGLMAIREDLAARRAVPASRLTTLAEQALAIDPAAAEWQGIAGGLAAVRDALAAGATGDAVRGLDGALPAIVAEVRRAASPAGIDSGGPGGPGGRARLRGAWAGEASRR